MKRVILYFLLIVVVALVFCVWLVLRQQKPLKPTPIAIQPTPIQKTNTNVLIQSSATSSLAPLFPAPDINLPVRPSSVDEETWSRWLAYRELILSIDQPIEFYARILDENEQPVERAKLTLTLGRIEGMAFATTNFSAWNPANAVREISFEVFSDSNGWIRVVGTNGSALDMTGLSKEGYSSSYPNGNFGGVMYKANGVRIPMVDVQMTNAWDSQKGVVLHLQKIEK